MQNARPHIWEVIFKLSLLAGGERAVFGRFNPAPYYSCSCAKSRGRPYKRARTHHPNKSSPISNSLPPSLLLILPFSSKSSTTPSQLPSPLLSSTFNPLNTHPSHRATKPKHHKKPAWSSSTARPHRAHPTPFPKRVSAHLSDS